MQNIRKNIEQKIKNKTAKIGVLGLGYVGLPLAMEFANNGFSVTGIDVDVHKVNSLNEGKSHIIDINSEVVSHHIEQRLFRATTTFSCIQELDAVSVCVPTPLNDNQEPDISYMESAANQLLKYMHRGILIVLESTTYPGTTRDLFAMRFEQSGFTAGEDYFLCFSPERVDPGNVNYQTQQIPKVIGGMTKTCTEIAQKLYGSVLDSVIPVSSPETAEMSKLLENTFRSVNIAFVNEMALLCDRMGINIWETIDAAATKPFGFMPFYPGPGVGGHCIPLDPMYLYWKGKKDRFFSHFIEIAQNINMNMPYFVVEKICDALNKNRKSLNGAKILILGLAYKSNINDVRESPALEVFESLRKKGAEVTVLDPYVTSFKDKVGKRVDVIQNTTCEFESFDCAVLLTKHSNFNFSEIERRCSLIVDTRNAWDTSEKVYKIGG